MKSFKSFYSKYGLKIELILAIFLDFWLILGHILMLAIPNNNFTLFLNDPIFGFVIATFVQFFIGRKFYLLMFKEIFKWHRLGMNTLIGTSSLFAYVWSVYALIYSLVTNSNDISHHNGFMYFFEIGTTIITFLLIGNYISDFLKSKVNKDINKVLEIQTPFALKYDLESKKTEQISYKSLNIGDYILVEPNTKVPIDCKIIENSSYFDESLLTGESTHIFRNVGSNIIGGSLNLTNSVICQVIVDPNKSVVANIIKRIKKIQASKSYVQKIADKIASWFVPSILILAIICFLVQFFYGYVIQQWLGLSDSHFLPHFLNPDNADATMNNVRVAIYFSIALIAISCPCALGLAIPLAIVVGIGNAGRNGIVYNNPSVFEKTKDINLVAFDKTGTITKNKSFVEQTFGDNSHLDKIYSLVQNAYHPLSKTIFNYLSDKNIKPIETSNFVEIPGVGLKAQVADQTIQIASYLHFLKLNYKFNNNLDLEKIKNSTNVCFAINNEVVFAFLIQDIIRDDALETINLLKEKKIKLCIISGDNFFVVKQLADKLGIDEYYANCSAFDKEQLIRKFQSEKYEVAFAGDGINDLIALQAADLSINMSLVNESANAVSDISVVNQNLKNVYNAIQISRKTRKIIWFNFLWAFIYNIVVIPLAFLGIVPTIIAVILMGFSDFAVVLNTLIFRLFYFKEKPKKKHFNFSRKKLN
ncbi:heavy metal translocating P-type ATPase [Mycoplasmoides pirum]|uniref:heavy metal translocating P-type ATPase n=1 Tax=Mycoplasmoides pirum TaxID=2122 RepID=UPI000485E8FC|nr:cation-translocating P-type ATPase [Mycoplasmoides pirum]